MTSDRQEEILALRSKNLTPKQIARKLGLKVSQVSAVVKAQAEQLSENQTVPPIVECFVDRGTADSLLREMTNDSPSSGLAQVTVVRSGGYNRYLVGTYLVDYWCLGLKDTIEVSQLNGDRYRQTIDRYYERFELGYEIISLEQAQAIIWGSIDYAKTLGLEPHPDFEKTKAHLGAWDGQLKLNFGRNGKPFYMSGPYDNSQYILEKLRSTVGENQFDYVINVADKLI